MLMLLMRLSQFRQNNMELSKELWAFWLTLAMVFFFISFLYCFFWFNTMRLKSPPAVDMWPLA